MDYLFRYFLASLRITSFLIAAPFFGGRFVPMQVRIIMGVSFGFMLASLVTIPPMDMVLMGLGFMIIIKEIFIGLAAAFILNILFSAVALAGEKISAMAGLSFALQVDPQSGNQSLIISQLFLLTITVLFLSLDGHLEVFGFWLRSYEILPITAMPFLDAGVETGIDAVGDMYHIAVLLMLPVVGVLLMINITIGIITRAAPQLNLFSFGFPISIFAAFVLLYISTPVLGVNFIDLINHALATLENYFMRLMNG